MEVLLSGNVGNGVAKGGRKQQNEQDLDEFSECILQQKSENTTIKTKSDLTWKRICHTENETREVQHIVNPLFIKLVRSR